MEWAYVAGYFDGEGHVSFHDTQRYRKTNALIWHNTHLASLEAIREFMDAGQIHAKKMSAHQNYQGYTLTVSRKADIIRVVDQMLPHLIIKREAAIRLRDHVIANVDDTRSANHGKMAAVSVEQVKVWYYEEGLSQTAIAKRVGVDHSAVAQYMRVRGLKGRPAGGAHMKGVPKSEEHKAKIRATKRKQWADPAFREAHLVNLEKGRAVAIAKARATKH